MAREPEDRTGTFCSSDAFEGEAVEGFRVGVNTSAAVSPAGLSPSAFPTTRHSAGSVDPGPVRNDRSRQARSRGCS